ncbi:MAG TPA: Fur family transcriptional regulator [Ktedonobacteraceae bacterium]
MAREKQAIVGKNEEEDTLQRQLRVAHVKITRPRLLVLNLLYELKGHYSADEIVELLEQRQTPLPRASVYNVLETLLGHGLVMIADAGPGRTLYEVGGAWHHHFVCLVCGAVIDIPCVKGEKPCLLPDHFSGIVEEAQIIFRGYCEPCASKRAPANTSKASTGL